MEKEILWKFWNNTGMERRAFSLPSLEEHLEATKKGSAWHNEKTNMTESSGHEQRGMGVRWEVQEVTLDKAGRLEG